MKYRLGDNLFGKKILTFHTFETKSIQHKQYIEIISIFCRGRVQGEKGVWKLSGDNIMRYFTPKNQV